MGASELRPPINHSLLYPHHPSIATLNHNRKGYHTSKFFVGTDLSATLNSLYKFVLLLELSNSVQAEISLSSLCYSNHREVAHIQSSSLSVEGAELVAVVDRPTRRDMAGHASSSDAGSKDIPLEFFPDPGDTTRKKPASNNPKKHHGVLTVPTHPSSPSVGSSDVAVLLLHGAGGDMHGGHLAGILFIARGRNTCWSVSCICLHHRSLLRDIPPEAAPGGQRKATYISSFLYF